MSRISKHDERFTIDELAERAARALSVGYDGPADGRAREVPDLRTLRYYTTLGLLDRPVEMRGRTALYARRHVMQVVAIKRLQADGLALAEVQAELAGITDTRLERIARLPETLPPAPPAPREVVSPPALPAAPEPFATPPISTGRFWTVSPAPRDPAALDLGRTALIPSAPTSGLPYRDAPPTRRPVQRVDAPQPQVEQPAHTHDLIAAIRLADGVTLLVDSGRVVPPHEIAALRAAAAPLVHELVTRGLALPPSSSPPPPPSSPDPRRPR